MGKNVVLVADRISLDSDEYLSMRRDLEQSDQETIDVLISTICELGRTITHYQSPAALAENAEVHKNDIVLTIFGGERSRNRMALVPAICESFGLRFIGPDTYGRVIAQDKEVSKRLALDCGLRTPLWKVVRSLSDLSLARNIKYPCVVKPVMEGSSIGISEDSLVHMPDQLQNVAKRLLDEIEQPVLIEEYVRGRETAFIAIERGKNISWAYSEIVIEGKPEYFYEHLFDASEKNYPTTGRTVCNIDEELDPSDRQHIEQFLSAFGRFGYCRVDGRHADGKFHFLELTPDAWIDPKGQFAMAFTEKGWTYKEVIDAVLSSADEDLPYQPANG